MLIHAHARIERGLRKEGARAYVYTVFLHKTHEILVGIILALLLVFPAVDGVFESIQNIFNILVCAGKLACPHCNYGKFLFYAVCVCVCVCVCVRVCIARAILRVSGMWDAEFLIAG